MRKKTVLLCLVVGISVGIFFVAGFNLTMSYTNTDEFCLSCHNHQIPYDEYKKTIHYSNAHGVSAGCADCHVPHEFLPKMIRKVSAAKEVFGHITGVIDSDEKYLIHRHQMKTIEIERLHNNDSAECRNCHKTDRFDLVAQSARARFSHTEKTAGKTCIDCHQGIAHTPEASDEHIDF